MYPSKTNAQEVCAHDHWDGLNVKDFWDLESIEWERTIKGWEKYEMVDASVILAKLGNQHFGTLIDCGCGNCRLEPYWSKKASQIISIDVSPQLLRKAKQKMKKSEIRNVHLILADAAHAPLKNNIGDATLCLGVLRHLPADYGYNVILENIRITKNGGKIYFNDIPNLFHIETLTYKIGVFLYTKILRKKAKGVFYYNPFVLQSILNRHAIFHVQFLGFNCKFLPVHITLSFFPILRKMFNGFHASPNSRKCLETRSSKIDFQVLQYCTLEFICQRTACARTTS